MTLREKRREVLEKLTDAVIDDVIARKDAYHKKLVDAALTELERIDREEGK